MIAHLHESVGWGPVVDPFLDDRPRGTFASRSPHRPNPVSISLCTLVAVDAEGIVVEGLDLLDGTPVLDLKPYVPLFDAPAGAVAPGWFEDRAELIFERTSDERFEQRSRRHRVAFAGMEIELVPDPGAERSRRRASAPPRSPSERSTVTERRSAATGVARAAQRGVARGTREAVARGESARGRAGLARRVARRCPRPSLDARRLER